jgi:methyl-accepting chemotaxis protein
MFNNFKIGTRLGGAFGLVVIILISVIVTGYINLERFAKASDSTVHTYQVLEETTNLVGGLVNIETGQRGFLVAGKDEFLGPYTSGKEQFLKAHAEAKKLTSDNPAQQARLDKLLGAYQAFLKEAVDTSIAIRRDVGSNVARYNEVIAVVGSGKTHMDAMRVIVTELDRAERDLLVTRAQEMVSLHSLTNSTLMLGAIIGFVLAVLLAFWVTRSITRPVGEALAVTQRLAEGDLTVRIDDVSKDEIGQMLSAQQGLIGKLNQIIGEVKGAADALSNAAAQVSQTAQSLSQSSSEQAASVEETTASIEQMTASITQNTENAKVTDNMASKSSVEATQGGTAVKDTVEAMKSIASKIGIIDDIAYLRRNGRTGHATAGADGILQDRRAESRRWQDGKASPNRCSCRSQGRQVALLPSACRRSRRRS